MKNKYTHEEEKALKEIKILLLLIKAGESKKFVLKAIAWIARRNFRKLDDEFFKPRVEEFMKKNTLAKMEYVQWHFQVFEMLKENEERITDSLPSDVLAQLV